MRTELQGDLTQAGFATLKMWRFYEEWIATCGFLIPSIFRDNWQVNFSIPQIPKVKNTRVTCVNHQNKNTKRVARLVAECHLSTKKESANCFRWKANTLVSLFSFNLPTEFKPTSLFSESELHFPCPWDGNVELIISQLPPQFEQILWF